MKESGENYLQNKVWLLPFLVLISIFVGCQPNENTSDSSPPAVELPPANEEFFQEITESTGVNFTHSIGDGNLSNIVETIGGGAVLLDYDQDGFLDLYVSNGAFVKDLSKGEKPKGALENKLYQNQKNGSFKDVTKKAGVGDREFSMGMTVGDYDNDGYPDIFVSNYGSNTLYRNNGNGTFANATSRAGIKGNECSVGAVWFDYDNDGFLDLYIGNYLEFDPQYDYYYAPDNFPGPMAYDGQSDKLYHNLGDGTFEDVTQTMGIFNPEGRAMGVGSADYDNDGYADIFVANDHMINYMYHNEAGKGFKDVGVMSGVAFNQVGEATISMAVDFADYNNDGLLDLFVSDDSYCSLYQNQGDGVFADMSNPSGIAVASAQHVGWASAFIDYDNDGDLDIFKANGAFKHLYGHEDQLFEQVEGNIFKDVSTQRSEYFKKSLVGRGACFGDYDNDGDLDVYIVNLEAKGVFLRNNKGNENNWLLVQLIGTTSNRDGVGAKVNLKIGDRIQTTEKKSSRGYLSQNDPRLHFGLGKNEMVESIEVVWPSGKTQKLENIPAGQVLTITEP
ncbi:MAG: CRTAC1 family protein [Bacteroidetes bacterium]|nr:CRTAC1 family protein [Bacteroidota bacterium]